MTHDEAKIIAKLIGHADGGCPNCVQELVEIANRNLPQFIWTYDGADLHEEYPSKWDPNYILHDHYLQVNVKPRP